MENQIKVGTILKHRVQKMRSVDDSIFLVFAPVEVTYFDGEKLIAKFTNNVVDEILNSVVFDAGQEVHFVAMKCFNYFFKLR